MRLALGGDPRGGEQTGAARALRGQLRVALAFGAVLAAMNLSFYAAIDRIPLRGRDVRVPRAAAARGGGEQARALNALGQWSPAWASSR